MQQNKSKSIQFSVREINVIKLVCKQFSTKEIADTLKLHTRTVEDYRHAILEKTGARNIAGIVTYALTNEIIKLSEL